jgi:inositol oxygenase
MDAMEKLNDLVDESDPDTDVPNVFHGYQTAEGIRKAFPDRDWMVLVGLIHDLGKMMCFYGQPQWSSGEVHNNSKIK